MDELNLPHRNGEYEAPIVVVPNHPTLPGLDYLGGLCNHETVGASNQQYI